MEGPDRLTRGAEDRFVARLRAEAGEWVRVDLIRARELERAARGGQLRMRVAVDSEGRGVLRGVAAGDDGPRRGGTMIKKTARGYVLYSKDGSRKLGGPYKTREEALRRERQVQFFKHAKKRAS